MAGAERGRDLIEIEPCGESARVDAGSAASPGPAAHAGRALEALTRWQGEFTRIRRELHAHPELGFEEVRTASRVMSELERYGVDEIHAGIGRTGVVALIHGRGNGPAGRASRMIGLRADMDALPVHEENAFAWRSERDGLMHACGHDGHTTMLLGAARYLAATRRFDGTACCIFQPGEEGFAGAKAMIDDGLFDRFPVESVYAMHNWPALAPGRIGVNAGPMMAAADRITITIDGRGGHGAHPHRAVDPVLVAAHIITAAQSVVARNVDPFEQAVVSLCAMQAGDTGAMSVIPRQATLVGTVRTFDAAVQDLVEQRLRVLCESVAVGLGATARVHYERLYPATVNSPAEAAFAAEVAESLVGRDNVTRALRPSMGAEDFSFMLHARPGA